MESHVITVEEKAVAEAIAKGLTNWFDTDPVVREADGGWGGFSSVAWFLRLPACS